MTMQNSSLKHPNIAKEILSSLSMLQEYIRQIKLLFGVDLDLNDLIASLSPIIEKELADDVQTNVLNSIEVLYKNHYSNYLHDLKQTWATLANLPIAAATTEAGWRKALDIRYKKNIDYALVTSMPGTPIANLTQQIMNALTLEFSALRLPLEENFTTQQVKATYEQALFLVNKSGVKDAKSYAFLIIGIESRKHIKLVWHQANKLQNVFPQKSAGELLAYGWFGLRTALSKYDPSLGFAFSTYACTRITGSIRDGVRAESPIPKRLTTFARKVDAAEAFLTQQLGRSPSLKEISSYLGEDIAKFSIMPRLAQEASIEEMLNHSSENGGFPEFLAENSDPANAVLDSFTKSALIDALSKLPTEEAEAIKLLILEEINPSKARVLTGTTARQMRSRKEKGLALLKEYLGPWDPTIE